jgi:hypothetical protein
MTSRARTFADGVRSLLPRLTLAAAAVTLVAACEAEHTVTIPNADLAQAAGPKQGIFYGAAVKVGDGVARSYFTMERGQVREVGVALSERALRGLPAGSGHSDGSHAHYNEYLLRMHPQNPTPYQFIELNWNPDGHEPDGVYTVPHFDFHFYMISLAQRNAIDPSDPQWRQKANNVPSPEFIPEFYVPAAPPIPGIEPADIAVPRMGVHWIDFRSPELAGAPFSETFIYGTWDGRVIFAEPMITKAMLESKPNFRRQLPVAEQGYNPGSYRIYWDATSKEYRVALTDLPAQ